MYIKIFPLPFFKGYKYCLIKWKTYLYDWRLYLQLHVSYKLKFTLSIKMYPKIKTFSSLEMKYRKLVQMIYWPSKDTITWLLVIDLTYRTLALDDDTKRYGKLKTNRKFLQVNTLYLMNVRVKLFFLKCLYHENNSYVCG